MKKDCKKDFERISEYLDGELDDDICRKIEEHLSHCPPCRECVGSLRKTIRLCKEGAIEEIPSDARERLRSKLRECFSQNRI